MEKKANDRHATMTKEQKDTQKKPIRKNHKEYTVDIMISAINKPTKST